MEEFSRPHKDVPFGWLLAVQDLVAARRRASARRRMKRSIDRPGLAR